MHEEFVDDRLNQDMTEIRKLMKREGTYPVFEITFMRNNDNDIVARVNSRYGTVPYTMKKVTSLEEACALLAEHIKTDSIW